MVMVVVVMMVVLLVGCWSSHAVCHGVGHELQEDLQKILGSTLKPIADAEEHLFGERLRRGWKGNE